MKRGVFPNELQNHTPIQNIRSTDVSQPFMEICWLLDNNPSRGAFARFLGSTYQFGLLLPLGSDVPFSCFCLLLNAVFYLNIVSFASHFSVSQPQLSMTALLLDYCPVLSRFLTRGLKMHFSPPTHGPGESLAGHTGNGRERKALCENMRIGFASNKCPELLTWGTDM